VTGTTGPTGTPDPTHTPDPTRTPQPTIPAGQQDDGCESNEDFDHACTIGLNTTSPPQTLPPGDQDVFVVATGPAGTPITVHVWQEKLDLVTTLYDASFQELGTLASPTISTTLPAEITGPLYLVVHSRSLAPPGDDTYRIEVRRAGSGSPGPGGTWPEFAPTPSGASQPDMLENNWTPAVAAPIAQDYSYLLNFICPVPGQCEGGDHDWLTLPVKAGVTYYVATFDLDPGVDTVLTLYLNDEAHQVAANDDVRPGAPLSALTWTAPHDGQLYVLVAPRAGTFDPVVIERQQRRYRLVVSEQQSRLAQEIQAIVQAQAAIPTATATVSPTHASAGSGKPAAPAPPAPAAPPAVADRPPIPDPRSPTPVPPTPQDAPTGQAVVITTTRLLTGPGDDGADLIATLGVGQRVTLLGQAKGLWVFVETDGTVRPGWVDARDLRRGPGSGDQGSGRGEPTPDTPDSPDNRPAAPPVTVDVAPGSPVADPPAPTPAAQDPLSVDVLLVQSDVPAPPETSEPGAVVPTPDPAQVRAAPPLAGMRVHLVTVFGDVLTEAVTPDDGRVTLTRDVPPGTALFVLIPAAGVLVPVDLAAPELVIAIPIREGAQA
jgi:hypothetical protein